MRGARWSTCAGRSCWGALACALGVAVLAGCADPLAMIQERPEDLARQLPARESKSARSLKLEDFRRSGPDGTQQPAEGATPEIIAARASAITSAGAGAVSWSLSQVLAQAVVANLELQASLLDPKIAGEALSAERARFEAVFVPSARFQNDDNPTLNTTTSSNQRSTSVRGGVNVPLRTGGRATIGLSGSYLESDNSFLTNQETYSSGVDASVTLPFLRGSGRAVNAIPIKIAGYQTDLARLQTKLQIIGVLASTERAYWNLVAARQQLVVRQKQLELAQEQLARARRRIDAGDAAEIEATRAESGVASSLGEIITAETAVLIAQRELKRLVISPDAPVQGDTGIVPTTQPEATGYALDTARLLTLAAQNRTELLQTELELLVDALRIDSAKDATRPLLNGEASYRYDGLGDTFYGSTRTLTGGNFQSWGVGISGEVPLNGNQAAVANLRQSMLVRTQRLITGEARRETIKQDVLDAVDRVNSAWQRIIAAQQSSILAGRTLEAEQRQFDAGLRTSTDVLDAATRLSDSQSQEVRALADYRRSLVDLAVATGTVLGAQDIRWEALPEVGDVSTRDLPGERTPSGPASPTNQP